MSLRPVVTWPDPGLNVVCAPIEAVTDNIRTLAHDMLDTMYAAPGRGLAAPQVGVMLRMFVMDPTWKEGQRAPFVCINPDLVERSEALVESAEGCLSIPGVSADVMRHEQVRMVWSDLDGVVHDQMLSGFTALCAQHELDHLDGVLTLDRVDDAQRSVLLAQYNEVR